MSTGKETASRERIVTAALDLFCERGFAAVGVQEICDRAGVFKGTLYHFFPAKLDVAVAALRHYGDAVGRTFAAVAAGPGDPDDKLLAVFAASRAEADRSSAARGVVCGCLHGTLAQELAAVDGRMRAELAGIAAGWAAVLGRVVAELQAAGRVPPGDPVAGGHLVLALLNGAVLAAKTANDPAVVTRMGAAALGLLGGRPGGS